MAKHCIYCKAQIDDDAVVDVCRRCGIGVWGEKMFNAIVENMQSAKEAGDLYQGSVTDSSRKNPEPKKPVLSSIAQEALSEQKRVEEQVVEQEQKVESAPLLIGAQDLVSSGEFD